VKPELTFRRSLRLIGKRWWLLVVGGVVFAALAFLVTGSKKSSYVATTILTINDVTVQANPYGQGVVVNSANPKFTTDWTTNSFVSPSAADKVSSALGGSPSSSAILSHLVVTPLSTTNVELDYTGNANRTATIDVLRRYATALINARVAQELAELSQTHVSLENQLANSPRGAALKTLRNDAAAVLEQQGTLQSTFATGFEADPSGHASKSAVSGPPTALVVFGGFIAGLAGGALLALVLGRLDKRVRRPDDIEVVGVPVVDIDSEVDPASVQLLRSELELAGIGTRLGVMAVTRATRGEGSSGLALALARTFAGVGTPTILVSADLRARKVRSEAGLSALLDGTADIAPLVRLEPNLQWLPEGSSNALPETLFSAPRVERIVRELRDQAGVIVIDTPAVLEDSETLPLIACSDIVLLAVRPGMTSWNPFGSAVALIQRVAKRPLHICYDRADETSSVPATGERRSDAAERVHQAIEVPASS
jgi:capsular polysaccharide biosynthesis protein